MDTNNPNNQVPSIPESEMKLPDEQYQETNPEPVAKKSAWTAVLLVLVVVLLAAMTAVIVWGEELVNMILPPEAVETPMPPSDTPPPETEAATIEDIEAEIEDIDFTAMEAELNDIEAEIEAESSATATP